MQLPRSESPHSQLNDGGKGSAQMNYTLEEMGLSSETLELATKEPMASPLDRGIKRGLDVVFAATLLLLLSPLLLLVSVLVATTSKGPVLFSQERWGKNDSRFLFFKFRTMCSDLDGDLASPEPLDGSLLKLRNDPRVTRVGRILRKTSLDELPQLWNVVRGEMSMVGPRPLVIPMLAASPEFRQIRGKVQPGITGLWQVRDRKRNDHVLHMARHDIEYVITRTNWLDIKILGSTVPVVLSCRGAF
jgi:lipopolysaccharide/colanic/teichoic acid biosynthesis glycosyltransferase